jgi:hypothetical protein
LQAIIGAALAAGKIHSPAGINPLSQELLARYVGLQKLGMPFDPSATHLALTTWSVLHGITSLYLYGYLGRFLAEQVEGFVLQEIEQLVTLLGLE